jgi:hypothetical protein
MFNIEFKEIKQEVGNKTGRKAAMWEDYPNKQKISVLLFLDV